MLPRGNLELCENDEIKKWFLFPVLMAQLLIPLFSQNISLSLLSLTVGQFTSTYLPSQRCGLHFWWRAIHGRPSVPQPVLPHVLSSFPGTRWKMLRRRG